MRKDMNKILREDGSGGGKNRPSKGTRKELNKEVKKDWEGSPKRVSNSPRRMFAGNHKESYALRLNPLENFIVSQVGRKWDDVYSEICLTITDKELRKYVENYVCLNAEVIDGIVYDNDAHYYRHRGLETWKVTYVDPKTGILRKTPITKRKYRYRSPGPSKDSYCATNNPMVCYCKDSDGIWYECYLRERQKAKVPVYLKKIVRIGKDFAWVNQGTPISWQTVDAKSYYDMFAGQLTSDLSPGYAMKTYGLNDVYCHRKRQLNKREIKKAGLNNRP